MVTPDTSDTPDTLCVSLINLIQKALPWIILGRGGAKKLGEIYPQNFVILHIEWTHNFAIPPILPDRKFVIPPTQGMPCILYVTL